MKPQKKIVMVATKSDLPHAFSRPRYSGFGQGLAPCSAARSRASLLHRNAIHRLPE
jgi:hypothetical protein